MTSKDWSEYYKITKAKPPSKLLVSALEHVTKKEKALDIGGGALKDSRYLLEQGFDVTVFDKSPLMEPEALALQNPHLHPLTASFEDFNFPRAEYDIASAMYALPFAHPQHFDAVFQKIKDSLVPGGIFCGQFFGLNDAWAANPEMTFCTKEHTQELLADMETIYLGEEEKDAPTAKGDMKHWHVFHIIARKR